MIDVDTQGRTVVRDSSVFSLFGTPVNATAPRILLVDDDRNIRTSYDEILSSQGYEVTTAGSRADAMAQIDRLEGWVDVLILDITLPDGDGAQVARDISAQIGQRPTLYVSGWTEEFWDLFDAPGRWRVMQKPIPVPRLIAALEWLSGRRETRPDEV
jgi:DNA-binding response OmpR family regulator